MLIVLSPAKSLDFETPVPFSTATTPRFLDRSAQLIALLRGYSPQQLAGLMHLSDALSALNVARYASWTGSDPDARQAIMAFNGDVYDGFDARSMDAPPLEYAQRHLRILSGLYGLLRPFDLIEPHRLEMGTRLPNAEGKDLYAFWGDAITRTLAADLEEARAGALVNLASEEYFRSVRPQLLGVPVITPVFEDFSNGRYKVISFHAKRARGLMARYAALAGLTDAGDLRSFDLAGYRLVEGESSATRWLFRRESVPA